jgi:hypothetical protein
MFKTLDVAHAKPPCSFQSRDGGCADEFVLSKANIAQSYKPKVVRSALQKTRNFAPLQHWLSCGREGAGGEATAIALEMAC